MGNIKKITPKNYKRRGYDNYYKIKGKYLFTIEDEGYEEIYDELGNYIGEMS